MTDALRVLSEDEMDMVAGGDSVEVEYVGYDTWRYNMGNGIVADGVDSDHDGYLESANFYQYGQWVSYTDNPYGDGMLSGHAFSTVQAGYDGFVLGYSEVIDGDKFLTLGVGTPGFSYGSGYSGSGDLSGWSLGISVPVFGEAFNFDSSGNFSYGAGTPGIALTYTVDMTSMASDINITAQLVNQGILQTYGDPSVYCGSGWQPADPSDNIMQWLYDMAGIGAMDPHNYGC